jgi:AraC-like DNA-binding protein
MHIVRHHSGHGHWEIVFREPATRLRTYVRHYQGYVASTKAPMLQREPPSGDVVLIISLGPGLRSVDPWDPAVATEHHHGFVAGLHDSYALIETSGVQQGLEIRFTPIGAHLVFGLPMHTLANRTVALDDIIGPPARQVAEQLHGAPDWESRFAILDSLIASRLAQAETPGASAAVTWAWNQLRETNGHLAIGMLASELGCSRKHLIAQFHEQIGLSPKMVARILRFRHAVHLLDRNNEMSWVQIAHDCGYYDQAHLIRDFRQFAGSTPGEFLRRRLLKGSNGVDE